MNGQNFTLQDNNSNNIDKKPTKSNNIYIYPHQTINIEPLRNQMNFFAPGGRWFGTLAWTWSTPSPTRDYCQGTPIGQDTLWQQIDPFYRFDLYDFFY